MLGPPCRHSTPPEALPKEKMQLAVSTSERKRRLALKNRSNLLTKHRDDPPLYKARLPKEFPVEGHERRWPMLFLTVLPAVALGLVLFLAYMALKWFPEKDAATVDTLPALHYTKPSVTMITPPRGEFLLRLRNLSGTAVPEHGHVFPSPQSSEDECSDPACRSVAQWMRSHIDFNVDPCNDFYKYVCGSFRGSDTFNQTIEIVKWMISMNLDFINTTRLLSVNPVEVMVRGSLDLGVEALISITFDKTKFTSGKRVMTIDYSKEQDVWLQKRSLNWLSTILSDYSLYLLMWGMRRKDVYRFAGKIRRYETERLAPYADHSGIVDMPTWFPSQ
ncbi:hypothetical protein HPB50_009643 [Hyalomma asiaticum]|uniref:Uncharacterized protein n=1 Tax=Hyalomma asiaticum TaxID=266040 RepID=A0ACB7SDX0_HYAAI|nr:hypothetical protein HPB50_009643 [Hyalomma asiaticum]